MEIKTKFNPGDKVMFLYNNYVDTGVIDNIIISRKKAMPIVIKYQIKHSDWITDCIIERYENEIFNNKEELLNSIKDKLQSINL